MAYLHDHRKLAVEMELYSIDEEVGAGLPLWLPNGSVIREELEKFIKQKEFQGGYQRVFSPHLAKSDLYEKSGHLKFYKSDMYPAIKMENLEYFLKPMNCPHHHQIFKSSHKSYKDLPLRLAEYGQVYRYESSGALRGLSRVRGLCQNDAHIYIRPNQAIEEVINVLKLHEECYQELQLKGYRYRLSIHDPASEDFQGDKQLWVECEDILRQALIFLKLEFFEAIGEAAFYGPKIDVQMKFYNDEGLREESMGSVQLDFISADVDRFNLKFDDSNGEQVKPWIIHRAPLGSHERFVAMLLEYFDGKLPRFLAPIELMIYPLNEEALIKAEVIKLDLMKKNIRVQVDKRLGSSLSKRILLGSKLRAYSSLVIGDIELSNDDFIIKRRDGVNVNLKEF